MLLTYRSIIGIYLVLEVWIVALCATRPLPAVSDS